jgi:hypothetical protein
VRATVLPRLDESTVAAGARRFAPRASVAPSTLRRRLTTRPLAGEVVLPPLFGAESARWERGEGPWVNDHRELIASSKPAFKGAPVAFPRAAAVVATL